MNSQRLLFSIILSALVLVTSATAQIDIALVQHDTEVASTYNHLKACSCGGQIDMVTVKNLGQLESYYAFSLEADKAWFTLDRAGAWLRPGESIDVYVFTSAPCDAVGTATYSVHVASEYGRYRAVEKTIQVGVCESILASITPTYSVIEPCETQRYELSITNVATFTETYSVDWLGFETVTIPAGETRVIDGSYTAVCNEWGNKTIPVLVHSERNGLTKKLPVTIEVLRAFDYQISLGELTQPVCAEVTSEIPVYVRNLENRANTIILTLTPGDETMNVTVPGRETRVVAMPFTPSRAGERAFTVSAISENGAIEKEAKLTTSVEACFGYELEAPPAVTACTGSVAVPFTITSEGSRTQTIDYTITSNTTVSISSLQATLRPGEVTTALVHAIIPNADRTYYVTFNASTAHRSEEQTVAVEGISTETCFLAEPTAHKFRVWTDDVVVPVIISQEGYEPATYTVSYDGTFADVLEQTITLAPGQQTTLHLLINASGYDTGRYTDRLTLSANGVDYVTDFELNLREKGFWQQFLDTCSADEAFAVCSVTSIIALLFLVVVIVFVAAVLARLTRFENPRGRNKSTWGIIGGLLLIAMLALMIFSAPTIPRTYERPIGPSEPADLAFEIGQGQAVTVDLSAYFNDFDNDSLRFAANQPEHLSVSINGANATIRSKGEWAGTEYLVFTANDGRGGYTDSDLFTVSVVPYRPVTFLEYWHRACWFLTALFLFIGLALLLLLVLFSPTRNEQRPPPPPSKALAKTERAILLSDEPGVDRPLTRLERDVLQQAQTMVNAERIVINQGEQKETVYVASQDGKRFHTLTCPVVRNMPKDKRVTFNTKEDAVKGGYSPCKTCSSHK
jgi:hypothetical protein